MGLANYGELKASIATWLNRDDLTSSIPDFITLAEKRLSDDLGTVRHLETESDQTATGSSYAAIDLPSDYLGAKVFRYTTSNPTVKLGFLASSTFYENHPDQTAGNPTSYTITAGKVLLAPVPVAGSIVQFTYYAKPAAMSADTDANGWLTNYPNAMLYGALLEAAPFLGDDPRISTWDFLYNRAVGKADEASDRENYAGSALQVRVTNVNP